MTTQTAPKVKATVSSTDLTKNRIAFQKGILVPSTDTIAFATKQQSMTIQAELMKFGYMLTEDALKAVTVEWFKDVFPFLKKNLGVGNYRPFYENFPTQVMEMSHAELYWNAIIHYMSNGTWEPTYELKDRGFEFENVKFKMIELGTEEDFALIFTRLVGINQSITPNDKLVVEWFAFHYTGKIVMPSSIPFKETLCALASLGLEVPVKTPTDVLRIAVHFSGGDISLPAVPKVTIKKVTTGRRSWYLNAVKGSQELARKSFRFKKFSRADRKYLLGLLEKTNLDLGEMKLKLGRWTRLAEILHPGEHKLLYPKAFQAFHILRNEPNVVRTFYANVEQAFDKSLEAGLKVLATRPGEFARRLDYLVRTYNHTVVMKAFQTIAPKVSRKVLWELYNHFLNRSESRPRSVMIKGARSIRKQLEPLPAMSKVLINQIQTEILKCVSAQFAELEPLGKVYLDERLKKVPLPAAMRSANTSVQTYVRGTRVPFSPTTKVVRAYVHWFDQNGTEDIDLSADFRDKDLQVKGHISYTNLRSLEFKAAHSGDIRHRRGSCAEYVDVDIESALKAGVRYIMLQAHNFNGRPMHTMKDCVFGVMEREHPKSNEIFKPDTITNAVAIANESTTVCIAILDLQARDFIWVDMEANSKQLATVESNRGTTTGLMSWLLNNENLTVYDLLLLHIESRGKLVSEEKDSDVQFKYEDFVTSYEKVATYM